VEVLIADPVTGYCGEDMPARRGRPQAKQKASCAWLAAPHEVQKRWEGTIRHAPFSIAQHGSDIHNYLTFTQ